MRTDSPVRLDAGDGVLGFDGGAVGVEAAFGGALPGELAELEGAVLAEALALYSYFGPARAGAPDKGAVGAGGADGAVAAPGDDDAVGGPEFDDPAAGEPSSA